MGRKTHPNLEKRGKGQQCAVCLSMKSNRTLDSALQSVPSYGSMSGWADRLPQPAVLRWDTPCMHSAAECKAEWGSVSHKAWLSIPQTIPIISKYQRGDFLLLSFSSLCPSPFCLSPRFDTIVPLDHSVAAAEQWSTSALTHTRQTPPGSHRHAGGGIPNQQHLGVHKMHGRC